jgi:hypothetical protein
LAKSIELCESALKRPLSSIFRILSIAKYPEGSVIDSQSMMLVEFSESARASRFCLCYEQSFVGRCGFGSALYFVESHCGFLSEKSFVANFGCGEAITPEV